jgi:hypothetical protein
VMRAKRLVCAQGIMVILKELCGRLPSLYDNVRQLLGSILVKLARRSRNHSSIIADGVIGLAVALLDTNDAEAKAPIPLESDEFGGLASKFSLPGVQNAPVKPPPRKRESCVPTLPAFRDWFPISLVCCQWRTLGQAPIWSLMAGRKWSPSMSWIFSRAHAIRHVCLYRLLRMMVFVWHRVVMLHRMLIVAGAWCASVLVSACHAGVLVAAVGCGYPRQDHRAIQSRICASIVVWMAAWVVTNVCCPVAPGQKLGASHRFESAASAGAVPRGPQ